MGLALGAFLASARAEPPVAEPPVSLIADRVTFDRDSGILTASGTVEIVQGGRILRASEISYDDKARIIRARGPIQLIDPLRGVVLAEAAELAPDLSAGLIESAQLLIAGQLQVAAAEARRTDGRFSTLYRTVASSCAICEGNAVPTWALRASRVTQDAEAMRIHFENATLEVYGLPVGWLPRLSIPDPSLARASGVLVPEVRNSNIYGLGLKVPYYRVLGPRTDATVTPFFTSTGARLFEGEYRQRFEDGGYDLRGVVALDDGLGGSPGRGAAFAVGAFALQRGFAAEFNLAVASDDTFLRQFDYTDADLLTSGVRLLRNLPDDYLELGTVGFQSLREDEDTGSIPFVLPEVTWHHLFRPAAIGGRVAINANALGIVRRSGDSVFRVGGDLDWRRRWTLPRGVLATAGAVTGFDFWRVENTASGESPLFRAVPNVNVELRWPLARVTAQATHVIEPIAQVIWSDTLGETEPPNNDSTLVEFDETNLFALNRFPGHDRVETGPRANIGLGYLRHDPDGWSLGATVGQVFRADPVEEFEAGTGLAGRSSDVVGAVSLRIGSNFSLVNRALFGTDLTFNRDEFVMTYEGERGALRAAYVYLAEYVSPVYGRQPTTNEFGLDARYLVHPNWELSGTWRYDVESGANLRAGAGVTYGNDCAAFDLSVSRRYTSSTNVPASTSVGFNVRLAGFGGSDQWKWPANVCVARKT